MPAAIAPDATGSSAAGHPGGATPPGPPRARRLRWPWRTVLAAAGGAALLLSFPSAGQVWLAPAAPLALALAVHGQRVRGGLWLGLVLGLAGFVPLLSWTGVYVGAGPWLALATACAVYVALLGGAAAAVSRLPLWPLWSACLWVAEEAARGRFPYGGFAWARLGLSQTSGPLMSLAAYGGVPLVSLAVALVGTLLAAAVFALAAPGRRRRRTGAVAAVGAAAALVGAGALAWLPLPGASLTAGGPARTVAVIQGDVPRLGLEFNAQRRAVLDDHVRETLRLATAVRAGTRPAPDLVIWPENSSDIDPYTNADAAAEITGAARAIGAPILVGAVVSGPGRYLSNTAIVWSPTGGPGQTYVKRHPVPFAEYIPDRAFFRLITSQVDRVRRDFTAGTRPGLLDVGGARVGDVICFEVADDGIVSDLFADGGARTGVLVVQTNNATFGLTDESAQQLAISRLRAVEYGRTVVIAATSGISAVVAPDGSVVRRSQLFTADSFDLPVAQRSGVTPAARVGALPEWTLTALGLAAVAAAAAGALRRRRRAGRAA